MKVVEPIKVLTLSLLLLTSSALVSAQELRIHEGGQWNIFLDDEAAQVHLLHRPEARTIFAFPSENSGVALWYEGEMRYREDSLRSLSDPSGQKVRATFEVVRPIRVETVLLDSLRVIRERNRGTRTPDLVREARLRYASNYLPNDRWAIPQVDLAPGRVTVSRDQPSYGPYSVTLESASVSARDGYLEVGPGELTVEVRCPFPKLEKLSLEQLLHPDYLPRLEHLSEREKAALEALDFLTTEEKMMAGSWRFLTYFGRDTLISLSMLEPILSDQALENGLRSVLNRLSPEGVVAHEEDIGSWAEWRHLRENPRILSVEPVYDYKMIDDDLLLPVLLRKLKQNGRTEVWEQLLADSEGRAAIQRNADYVLGRLEPGKPLLLPPGELVGEWRDSESGLAGGVDPYSVNGALTVPALHALTDIYQALELPEKARRAAELVPVYEAIAERFWVTLPAGTVNARLESAAAKFPAEERRAFEQLHRQARPEGPVTLPLLSFSAEGEPNLVSHTDVAFNLFYDELEPEELERILSFLERPFPVGVMTPVGPVVANPLLSPDPRHHEELGFGRYHGIVVWSWQSAMLQFGLLRQAAHHPSEGARISRLVEALEAAEERVGELANSELWGVTLESRGLTARAFGVEGDQTESNAMQLWSTVYPSLQYVKRSL